MKNDWQTEMPSEAGDWEWVVTLSCGCCIDQIGVVYITDIDHPTKKNVRPEDGYYYIDKNGVSRLMIFESNRPTVVDGKVCVTAWRKFSVPR